MSGLHELLRGIKADAPKSDVPLAPLLLRCLGLGPDPRFAELTAWASRELRGYGPDDQVPQYRTVRALVAAVVEIRPIGLQTWIFPVSQLAEELREHFAETLCLT